MSNNDRVLLDQILVARKSSASQDISDAAFFELFTAEQILKDFDPSDDDIESGIVGGSGDGGIDSLYLFLNGTLVREDTDSSFFKKDLVIDLVFIQSKTSPSFSEDTINKFSASSRDLLDLSAPLTDLSKSYRAEILSPIDLFQRTYKKLAERFPTLRIAYYYATKGDSPSHNVQKKADQLKREVENMFSNSSATVSFVGARELLDLTRRSADTTYHLLLADNPISASGPGGFLAIVNLQKYFEFIADDKERLRRHLFDANVRDYQGTVQVNKGIQETLTDQDSREDFWWLNNGITIVASQATHSGKTLTIENPLIVNGLQTSTEIFEYFTNKTPDNEQRNVLVRVIAPTGQDSRDKIIKATNSQTSMPSASLRATERIHRDIEQYLKPFGIYYDRRKNFYKNEGMPREKIIGIPKLAQAVMSIVLRRPHDARARPSTVINDDQDYEKIFFNTHHLDVYRVCSLILRKVEVFIKTDAANLEQGYRNNLKFHLAMYVALTACGESAPTAATVQKIEVDQIDNALLLECVEAVKSCFEVVGATDQMAKSGEFTKALLMKLAQKA